MKAAFLERTGPPDVIQFGEQPLPRPTGAQALVKVAAVAVNPIDTYIRSGAVAMKLPLPFIVGCDLAGTVMEVGPEVQRLQVGDKVWGTNQGLLGRQGTFAEFAAVDEAFLYPLPAGVTEQSAAALALVGITAHLGLVSRAKLQAGETVFVTGGSGGVGSTVTQIAKALGAKVITTAGSEAKAELCRRVGADHVIHYKTENVDERLKQLAPEGVNVWWEVVRETNFEQAVANLARNGRMILMAGREARPIFPVGPFYVKGLSLFGFAMFNEPPDAQRACANDLSQWLAEGKLHPLIDRVLPLSEAAAAHKLQEDATLGKSGALAGKLVLTTS